MNPEQHNRELEALVDSELKALPPLSAPPSLAPRILAAIAAQQTAPWYRAGWQAWPLPLRIASFAALLAVFAGLCFGGVKLWQLDNVTAANEKVTESFALLSLAGKILSTLVDAGQHVLRNIGPVYIVAGLAVVAMAYAFCLAFGSFYIRFALAKRENL